jgi:protein kinase C substrate 80K-H
LQENVKAEIAKKNAETRMERAQQLVDRLAENLEKMNASSSVVETDAGDAGDADGASDEAAGPDDAPFEGDEVEDVEEDETEEERAKRVASQWIHDEDDGDDGDDEDEDDEDYEEVYDAPGFEGDDDDDDSVDNAVDDADNLPLGLFDTIKLWIEDQTARLLGRVDVSRELKLAKIKLEKMKRLSNEARNKYQEKNRALRDLEREVTDLTTKQRYTYGDGDAFLVLSESCIESPLIDGKHSYSLCPFGAAKQMEGGKSTGLGTWEGFADVGGEAVMRFVNGDACWQGPRRSMEVSLKCGSQDSLDAVSEPSRCTYAGILTTPAFCSESIVEGLKKEIKRRRDIDDMVDSSAEDKGPHQEL